MFAVGEPALGQAPVADAGGYVHRSVGQPGAGEVS